MKEIIIRPLRETEHPLLEEFLYQAIFQREGEPPLPRDIINAPELAVYIENFGERPGDLCLVAEQGGRVTGAVWTRILDGPVKGFGHLDAATPEFALAVLPGCRGRGIGARLMADMLALLREKGYRQASLAVQKDNYALRLYRNLDFEIVGQNEQEYCMAIQLEQG